MRTIAPPQDFQYPEFVYKRPLMRPVPIPYDIPKSLEYYCASKGYRRTLYENKGTEDVIDISIAVSPDSELNQYIEITLHANEHNHAKYDRILKSEFHVNLELQARSFLEDMRNNLIKRMLTRHRVALAST